MAPSGEVPTTSGAFIDILSNFNVAELKDVIRVAQRCLKAKVERSRANTAPTAKQTWRFWDRPLELDWSSPELPKIQYPSGRQGQDIDWNVFNLLKGSGCEAWSVDWEVFELLSPKKCKHEEVSWDIFELLGSVQESAEPEEEPDSFDFSAVDWSGSRLPHPKGHYQPPMRRPGCPGRVRTGRYHRAIQPRSRKGSEGIPAPDAVSRASAPARLSQPSTKRVSPPKAWASRRVNAGMLVSRCS